MHPVNGTHTHSASSQGALKVGAQMPSSILFQRNLAARLGHHLDVHFGRPLWQRSNQTGAATTQTSSARTHTLTWFGPTLTVRHSPRNMLHQVGAPRSPLAPTVSGPQTLSRVSSTVPRRPSAACGRCNLAPQSRRRNSRQTVSSGCHSAAQLASVRGPNSKGKKLGRPSLLGARQLMCVAAGI